MKPSDYIILCLENGAHQVHEVRRITLFVAHHVLESTQKDTSRQRVVNVVVIVLEEVQGLLVEMNLHVVQILHQQQALQVRLAELRHSPLEYRSLGLSLIWLSGTGGSLAPVLVHRR